LNHALRLGCRFLFPGAQTYQPDGWGVKPANVFPARAKNFPNFLLADSGFGRSNGLFFEKGERCSSVIAVKCLGTW
jgi:hypothetical protein